MSQVTYTVGLLDGSAKVVYSGTLEVQLDVSNLGTTVESGLLAVGSFQPLLLTAVSGAGSGWTLYGSNASVSVSTTSIYPAVQPFDAAPSYIAGSISMTPQGEGEQNLLLLGYDGSAAAAAQRAAATAAEAGAAEAVTGIPPVDYNFSLQLLNTAFGESGTGTFTGTGQEVRIGPVSRQWMVQGTLTLDGGEAVSIQGWGGSDFWYGRGSTSGGTEIDLGFVPQTFISGRADGTITSGTETSFFVGTAASDVTMPITDIASQPTAEPA